MPEGAAPAPAEPDPVKAAEPAPPPKAPAPPAPAAAEPTPKTPEPEASELPVTEFCAAKAGGDRRVELISAFHAHELAAGRVKGTSDEIAARFDTFANAPA